VSFGGTNQREKEGKRTLTAGLQTRKKEGKTQSMIEKMNYSRGLKKKATSYSGPGPERKKGILSQRTKNAGEKCDGLPEDLTLRGKWERRLGSTRKRFYGATSTVPPEKSVPSPRSKNYECPTRRFNN